MSCRQGKRPWRTCLWGWLLAVTVFPVVWYGRPIRERRSSTRHTTAAASLRSHNAELSCSISRRNDAGHSVQRETRISHTEGLPPSRHMGRPARRWISPATNASPTLATVIKQARRLVQVACDPRVGHLQASQRQGAPACMCVGERACDRVPLWSIT